MKKEKWSVWKTTGVGFLAIILAWLCFVILYGCVALVGLGLGGFICLLVECYLIGKIIQKIRDA